MKLTHLIIAVLAMTLSCSIAAKHHRQQSVEVTAISEEYGNIETTATPATLENLGLSEGDTFSVGFNGKEVSIYLGRDYSDVDRGEWVAFVTDQGNLRLARNLENAAETLGVEVGDKMVLYN